MPVSMHPVAARALRCKGGAGSSAAPSVTSQGVGGFLVSAEGRCVYVCGLGGHRKFLLDRGDDRQRIAQVFTLFLWYAKPGQQPGRVEMEE